MHHLARTALFAIAVASWPAQAAESPTRIGAAAAVRGLVQLAAVADVRAVGKDAVSGDPIFLGDRVTTGPSGRLQIMLLDETVFTLGPKGVIVIDEFVYDPKTSKGKVAASILKGTFRFVTGKISNRQPSDMKVKLPVGSIGVRGTSVAGITDGTRATVVLLGPGPNANTGERIGRISVSGAGQFGGSTPVEIVRPGYGTEIAGRNVQPTLPVQLDPARLQTITGPLNSVLRAPTRPEQAQDTGGRSQASQPTQRQSAGAALAGTNRTDIAKQTGDGLAGGLRGIQTIRVLARRLKQKGAIAANQQAPPHLLEEAAFEPKPLGSTTTFEQLRSINSGSANFGSQNTILKNASTPVGSYDISYSYNFGSRTASGQVTINAGSFFGPPGNAQFPLLASPFSDASKTGPILIEEPAIAVPGPINGTANVRYEFRNVNGVIFKELRHEVTYTKGPKTGTGRGVLKR